MTQTQNFASSMNNLIRLGVSISDKETAIRAVAALLTEAGVVKSGYDESMLQREQVANTWLGQGVAIPHGMVEDKNLVIRDSIAVLQVPQGVEWDAGEKAYLIFGIAAQGDGHLATLRQLTRLMQTLGTLTKLFNTENKDDIIAALSSAPQNIASDADNDALPLDLETCIEWVVDYPNGLHARPAAAWIDAARASSLTLQVRNGKAISDMLSLVSLLQLNAKPGDRLVFSASGNQAKAGLDHILRVVSGLSHSEVEAAERAAQRASKISTHGWQPPSGKPAIMGVSASPGLAIGVIHRIMTSVMEAPDLPTVLKDGGPQLQHAIEKTRAQLKALIDDVTRRIGTGDAAIFQAQAEFLDDENLISATCRHMVDGHGVAWSWAKSVNETASRLKASDNPLLAARSADLYDIGRRVLSQIDPALAGGALNDLPSDHTILVADDLSPSDTAGLDQTGVCGLATALSGPTSHTAILARTLGLPAVVAGGMALLEAKEGQKAIIDGDSGAIWLDPEPDDIDAARNEIARIQMKREAEAAQRSLPAITTDGKKLDIAANINRPDQVPLALAQGGEAVGLMRTEFLFLERGDTPDEEEQLKTYRAMLEALDGRPLIVRALDIGGDKQVAHLNLPHEDNPFLGVRGARLLLRRPDLLYPQLRALYRAAKRGGDISIMFPMIMSAEEILHLKEICEDTRASLQAPEVPLGIMIEVPAAAAMADLLAAHVDFFSIGTNDLTQYTLAVDRQNPELAASADSLHPAVLRMINQTVRGAKKYNRRVGVCGGIAGDPFGATLLVGLGVTELSMTPRDIPAVKARLRAESLEAMTKRARAALMLETAANVRALDICGEERNSA